MASLGLDDDELKSIEQTLGRLSQLSSSIQSLKMDILKSQPLPPASSLQASAQILQRNLQTVLDSLADNHELFSRMAIHPSPNYPGRTQEGILTQLLRKKLEPEVEELVARGREESALATPEGIARLQDVWDEVREWTQGRIAQYVREEAGDSYTKEEREKGLEHVRTGLRQDLEDESEEEEDDEEDEEDPYGSGREDEEMGGMEFNGSATASAANGRTTKTEQSAIKYERGPEPEALLWFMSRADFEMPRNIEYERDEIKDGPVKRGMDGVNIPPEPLRDGQPGGTGGGS